MLSAADRELIRRFSAGAVATVRPDGTPSVSPKGTFVVLDPRTLAFGHIRSPGTIANLRANPAIEVCFFDVLHRRALRVTGRARIVPKEEADGELVAAFEKGWPEYVGRMKAFVVVAVTGIERITSPAYDIGYTAEQLKRINLERLSGL